MPLEPGRLRQSAKVEPASARTDPSADLVVTDLGQLAVGETKGEAMPGALAGRLDTIKTQGGIRAREVAQLLGTTPQTVSRWQTDKAAPQPASLKRLLALEWLIEQLAAFYAPDGARLWLFAPHPLLNGETPADRIQHDRLDDVLALIDQLRDGAYM
jgi:transcriptional regulator with XRE-family HTH domain